MSTDRRRLVEFTLGSGIPAVLEYWAKVIEKTANELCKDPDCKSIQFKIDVNRNVSIDTSDDHALDCLIASSKKLENSIPNVTQEIIHDAIHVYSQKIPESKTF